ncbi:MAG: diadenylate cyclase CdaA [bacterium]
MNFSDLLVEIKPQDIIDILIVAFVIYRLFLLIKGTKAVQMIVGLFVMMVVFTFSQWVGFRTTKWILQNFWTIGVLATIVLFQPELRRVLAQVGNQSWFERSRQMAQADLIDRIVRSCLSLSSRRVGALIVFERETALDDYIDAGTDIDAVVSRELMTSIFNTASPLHDGAVIIRHGRVAKAGSFLPLSFSSEINKELGTRHRSGMGITEETDALVVIVSEETGAISMALHGELTINLDAVKFRAALEKYLIHPEINETFFSKLLHSFSST